MHSPIPEGNIHHAQSGNVKVLTNDYLQSMSRVEQGIMQYPKPRKSKDFFFFLILSDPMIKIQFHDFHSYSILPPSSDFS